MKRGTILFGLALAALMAPIVARLVTAQGQVPTPGESLGEWKYPDANVLRGEFRSHGGPSPGVGAPPEAMTSALMTSKDDYDKVLNYYKEKTGIKQEKRKNPNLTMGPELMASALKRPGATSHWTRTQVVPKSNFECF